VLADLDVWNEAIRTLDTATDSDDVPGTPIPQGRMSGNRKFSPESA
jgi:hypothetical protein